MDTPPMTPVSTIASEQEHISRAHSFLRKAFFIACLIVFLLIFVFLVYQNGKSIYANGI